MKECSDLIALVQSCEEGVTMEFRKRCREQLRDCVAKLWTDHANHMGNKQARNAIWTVLHNGLGALRVE